MPLLHFEGLYLNPIIDSFIDVLSIFITVKNWMKCWADTLVEHAYVIYKDAIP